MMKLFTSVQTLIFFGEMFESVQGSDLTEAQRQWFFGKYACSVT